MALFSTNLKLPGELRFTPFMAVVAMAPWASSVNRFAVDQPMATEFKFYEVYRRESRGAVVKCEDWNHEPWMKACMKSWCFEVFPWCSILSIPYRHWNWHPLQSLPTVFQDESSPPDVTDTVGHLDLSIHDSLIESEAKYKSQVAWQMMLNDDPNNCKSINSHTCHSWLATLEVQIWPFTPWLRNYQRPYCKHRPQTQSDRSMMSCPDIKRLHGLSICFC